MDLELGQPVIELNDSIIAGEEFCNLSDIRTNERDCAKPIVTANKVRTNLFVPGLFMKDLILCNIDGTFVVTVKRSWARDGDVEVGKQIRNQLINKF